jgi:adenosine deaminase CECR1
MKNILTIAALFFSAYASADWFEDLKNTGGDDALYHTLHYMPKGHDLHDHLCRSNFSERLYQLALQQRERGYHC